MGFLIKLIIIAVAVYLAAYILPGVEIPDAKTTILVAIVLALLNTFIKPVLVFLTIPITVITLGLFLLIINAFMVMLADALVSGFSVDGWLSAILFGIIVTVVSFILNKIF